MKNSFVLFLSFIAVALGITPAAAKPADIGLNFDLAPTAEPKPAVSEVQTSEVQTSAEPTAQREVKPLDLPDRATQIPQGNARPPKPNILAELPPPPPAPPAPIETAAIEPHPAPTIPVQTRDLASLHTRHPTPDTQPSTNLDALFEGDENSLVARSVGSAEGTRTPEGGRTWAYRGHTDPGNQAWNLGTFSYQHGANSPEEADRKQLDRLNRQAQTLREHAADNGITLTLEEELNGIDLANQSPRAALSSGGYIDRLRQARDMGLQGSDAVLWARTRAFLDPNTNRWNAPGLGNNVHSITADQDRRRRAIASAIDAQPPIAAVPATSPIEPQITNSPVARREDAAESPEVVESPEEVVESPEEAIANLIISLDLPPS